MTIENIFSHLNIPFNKVSLGEVHVEQKLTEKELKDVDEALGTVGFDFLIQE